MGKPRKTRRTYESACRRQRAQENGSACSKRRNASLRSAATPKPPSRRSPRRQTLRCQRSMRRSNRSGVCSQHSCAGWSRVRRVGRRSSARPVRAQSTETDPRRAIALFIDHLSEVQERVISTYEVMKSAARSEPDVGELLARIQLYRFSNITTIPARLAELGRCGRALWRTTLAERSGRSRARKCARCFRRSPAGRQTVIERGSPRDTGRSSFSPVLSSVRSGPQTEIKCSAGRGEETRRPHRPGRADRGKLKVRPSPTSGPVAQLGARMNGIHEVTGSIPVWSTILRSPTASFGSVNQASL